MIKVISLMLASFSLSLSAENTIDPYVSDIVTIGEWEKNKQRGRYRFITKTYGSEHVFSKLYLQWLTYHMDGEQESKVVAEVSIKELNEKYYSFNSPKCIGDWKCQSFTLQATDSFTYKKHRFKLTIQGLRKYAISEQAL